MVGGRWRVICRVGWVCQYVVEREGDTVEHKAVEMAVRESREYGQKKAMQCQRQTRHSLRCWKTRPLYSLEKEENCTAMAQRHG